MFVTSQKLAEPKTTRRSSVYGPVLSFYAMEALASVSAVLLLTGIYFYTHRIFGWGMRQNLLLANGLGASYILGALSANRLSAALGRRAAFRFVQIILLALSATAFVFHQPFPLVLILILYSAVSGGQWPVLESMVSQASAGKVLSKRLAMYNLVWSAANVVALAVSGTIIQHCPTGIFVVAGGCTLCSTLLIHFRGSEPAAAGGHIQPETELLAVRTQALWLSRIALPSTYVVVCSLNAMMPSLPIMRSISTQWGTLLGSVWFAARCAAFAVLGVTAFWHTRPKLMLLAAVLMLIAFLGVTLRPSDFLPHDHLTQSTDLLSMISAQILLGAAMGIIYSASLYFGMVLSDGSTEHGGYHEALIGVGSVLGPASALVADTLRPGETGFGIAAVAGLIGLSVLAAVGAVAIGRMRERPS
jgi:MFS family permease